MWQQWRGGWGGLSVIISSPPRLFQLPHPLPLPFNNSHKVGVREWDIHHLCHCHSHGHGESDGHSQCNRDYDAFQDAQWDVHGESKPNGDSYAFKDIHGNIDGDCHGHGHPFHLPYGL